MAGCDEYSHPVNGKGRTNISTRVKLPQRVSSPITTCLLVVWFALTLLQHPEMAGEQVATISHPLGLNYQLPWLTAAITAGVPRGSVWDGRHEDRLWRRLSRGHLQRSHPARAGPSAEEHKVVLGTCEPLRRASSHRGVRRLQNWAQHGRVMHAACWQDHPRARR